MFFWRAILAEVSSLDGEFCLENKHVSALHLASIAEGCTSHLPDAAACSSVRV